MRRFIFNSSCLILGTFGLLATGAWVRSYLILDRIDLPHHERIFGLASSRGKLLLAESLPDSRSLRLKLGFRRYAESAWAFSEANVPNFWGDSGAGSSGPAPWPPLKTYETRWAFAGFVYQVNRNTSDDFLRLTTINARLLLVPYWSIVLLTLFLPAMFAWSSVRKAWAKRNVRGFPLEN